MRLKLLAEALMNLVTHLRCYQRSFVDSTWCGNASSCNNNNIRQSHPPTADCHQPSILPLLHVSDGSSELRNFLDNLISCLPRRTTTSRCMYSIFLIVITTSALRPSIMHRLTDCLADWLADIFLGGLDCATAHKRASHSFIHSSNQNATIHPVMVYLKDAKKQFLAIVICCCCCLLNDDGRVLFTITEKSFCGETLVAIVVISINFLKHNVY